MTLSSYNSKKLLIKRQERLQSYFKSSLLLKQRWLDNVLLRSVVRPKKHRLKSSLLNEHSKSSNAMLQPHKKLTIHLISVSEKPHTVLQKIHQSVAVLWVQQVRQTLHPRHPRSRPRIRAHDQYKHLKD